ncbi:MAG: type II toxin-antitoxin system HipA family toxin [Fibrobacteres bacterium]|nr:type II toxin-antitoxin system HipA family toxin [Fibrobacterota bacterium]
MAKKKTPFKQVEVIHVFMWGKHMGALAMQPAYGFYGFSFTEEFKRSGIEPAPLKMPTTGDEVHVFPNLPELTYNRLPAMLSDALPDAFGNALIDRYMAERGFAPSAVSALDRLAYMGKRSMGALEFKPSPNDAARSVTAIDLNELVEEAKEAISGSISNELEARRSLQHIIDVGTSAGGARAKAVIAWNQATNEIRSGQAANCPKGFEQWLLKFDGVTNRLLGDPDEFGRTEYAYHLMARAAKIEMTDCQLLEENGRAHFMTKRFDRDGSIRHHAQTLCAMAHLDYKLKGVHAYTQLFSTIKELGLPYEDLEQAYRRMVFNVMARNCDDHTKNVSFLLKQGNGWRLAPAYDMTFSYNPASEWIQQHLMSVNGKFKNFALSDLQAEAKVHKVGTSNVVIKEIRAAVAQWPEFARIAGVSAKETQRIQSFQEIL